MCLLHRGTQKRIVLQILLTAAFNGVALAEKPLVCAKPEMMPRSMSLLQSRKEHRDAQGELSDLVSRVYYINLEADADRRDNMEPQLQELYESTGLSYERFPAVYGKNDSWALAMAGGSQDSHHVLGTLGCFKSHVSSWRKALADKPAQTWAMVLEDDIHLDVKVLKQHLRSRLSVVPPDADIVLLGHWDKVRSSDAIVPNVYNASLPFFNPPEFYYAGFHSYLIKLSSVDKVANQVMNALNVSDTTPTQCSINIDCATHSSSVIHKYAILPQMAEANGDFGSSRLAGR